jgi:hypothetical protein
MIFIIDLSVDFWSLIQDVHNSSCTENPVSLGLIYLSNYLFFLEHIDCSLRRGKSDIKTFSDFFSCPERIFSEQAIFKKAENKNNSRSNYRFFIRSLESGI